MPPAPGSSSVGKLEFVSVDEDAGPVGDRDEAYKRLEQDLIQQIRVSGSGEHVRISHWSYIELNVVNDYNRTCMIMCLFIHSRDFCLVSILQQAQF